MIPEFHHSRKKGRALIVEGGGMRGSFAGGVLASMGSLYPANNFDLVVGVSAGSCDAAYYVTLLNHGTLSAQITSTLNIWRHELVGSKLINFLNPLRGKSFLDQEYLVDKLFGSKYRLPRERLDDPKTTPLYVVVSNLKTMLPEYIRATNANLHQLLKAATSLPIATRGRRSLGDHKYTDGGILDPIPVEAVLAAGYRKLTVILNRPLEYRSEPVSRLIGLLGFPWNRDIRHELNRKHHLRYNNAMEILNDPPGDLELTVISPEKNTPAGMLSRGEKLINMNIDLGIEAGYRAFADRVKAKKKAFQQHFADIREKYL